MNWYAVREEGGFWIWADMDGSLQSSRLRLMIDE